MEFNKTFLEEQFKEYYKENGKVATHVFIYSESQDDISKRLDFRKPTTKTKGLVYSEMRGRDADLVFKFEDTKFVAVGNYSDIKVK